MLTTPLINGVAMPTAPLINGVAMPTCPSDQWCSNADRAPLINGEAMPTPPLINGDDYGGDACGAPLISAAAPSAARQTQRPLPNSTRPLQPSIKKAGRVGMGVKWDEMKSDEMGWDEEGDGSRLGWGCGRGWEWAL